MAETEHDRQVLAHRLAECRRWREEADRACSAVSPMQIGSTSLKEGTWTR